MSPSEITQAVGSAVDGPGRVDAVSGKRPEQPEKPRQQEGNGPARTGPDTVTLSPESVKLSREKDETGQATSLAQTEQKVKAHEAAHKAAGGQLAGSATYQYRVGPDGKSYITGGEVSIDLSPGNTPEETITKMQIVIRAALAPADPSPQDRAVAAQAAALMAEAQRQAGESTAETADPARNQQNAEDNAGTTDLPKQGSSNPAPEISTYV